MSAEIERDFNLISAIHFDNEFSLNLYTITLCITIHTDVPREQQVAMDRVNYWLTYSLQDTVFVNQELDDQIMKYLYAGISCCTIPDEPHDQVIAMILLLKLNAITEGKVTIDRVSLESTLGDRVRYNVDALDAHELFGSTNAWFNDSCLSTNDYAMKETEGEKVVNLFDYNDWCKVGLHWREKVKQE
jgi:hypothetical protein